MWGRLGARSSIWRRPFVSEKLGARRKWPVEYRRRRREGRQEKRGIKRSGIKRKSSRRIRPAKRGDINVKAERKDRGQR